uniref:Serine/threonine-protein kinase LMTK2 n=1 Tax=Caligus clemensi TaxID=344056 RepID=C1C2K0_CALCM|nr:Serine/threonine-protein kinase LMTK2 precursor [Caligus clemensi]
MYLRVHLIRRIIKVLITQGLLALAMAQVKESFFILNESIVLSVFVLICFVVLIALLSTSFKAGDLGPFFSSLSPRICCCFRSCSSPQNESTQGNETQHRSNDRSHFVDLSSIDEAIDFTLQTPSPSKEDLTEGKNNGSLPWISIIPKSLKMDPFLCFDRRNLHFTSMGVQGRFGMVSKGMLGMADGSNREIFIRSLNATKKPDSEVSFFFEDLLKYHDINSDNIIQLIGVDYKHSRCLAIFNDGYVGDLKMFLTNREEADRAFIKEEMQISFCHDIVSGLKFWHQNFTIPLDFGARTCQVTNSFVIKIGDFGEAVSMYPQDYVDIYKLMNKEPQNTLEDRRYPIRWLSPEILHGLRGGKTSSFITRQSNIWNLGMTFWEILTFGQKPYPELSNRQVLFGDPTSKLETTLSFQNSTFFCIQEKVLHDLTVRCLKIDPRSRCDIFMLESFLTNFKALPADDRFSSIQKVWSKAFKE